MSNIYVLLTLLGRFIALLSFSNSVFVDDDTDSSDYTEEPLKLTWENVFLFGLVIVAIPVVCLGGAMIFNFLLNLFF